VPAIFERIEAVGLTTQEACGDTPRVFLGCPLAGVTAHEVLDATDDIRAVASRYVGDPAFSNLPRKYKTSISGCRVHCTNPEINDISLVGRRPFRRSGPATTCRSAAASPRTRCSRSGSAHSSSRRACRMCGPA
jgi:sulfite reductase beta subunit-like hemoprotein